MNAPFLFYLEQAQSCAKAAADAALPNQREILLRSEKAWQTLADRTAATTAARALREAEVKANASAETASAPAPETAPEPAHVA